MIHRISKRPADARRTALVGTTAAGRFPLTIVARLLAICLIQFVVGTPASAQSTGIRHVISGGISQTINWLPVSDSTISFRQSNGGTAESLATLGSELSVAYEWFPVEGLVDSAGARSVQFVAGYLQRGYRVVIAGTNECLRGDVYRTKASWLRLALFGRDNIPIARATHLVWQLGASYGTLISAFDNFDDIQVCSTAVAGAESVLPGGFLEASGGLGVRTRISKVVTGSFNVVYYYPITSSESETRPATTGEARSLLVDIRTPNLSINLGLGWMF